MWSKLQRNYLPILSGLIVVFLTAVVVLEVDRQIYQSKKKEICLQNARIIIPRRLTEKLVQAADRFISATDRIRRFPAERSSAEPDLAKDRLLMDSETSRILQAENSLVRIAIYVISQSDGKPVREPVLVRDADKYSQCNTLANSLVLKHFWWENILRFDAPDDLERAIGEIVFRYTTPQNIAEIRDLTRYYWLLLAAIVLGLSCLYWYVLRYLILPIKTVTSSIDRSKEAFPEILPNPRTILEHAYNDLARDALLNAVTRSMAEYMSVDRLIPPNDLVALLPEMIAPGFGFAAVHAAELSFSDPSQPAVLWSRSAFHAPKPHSLPLPGDAEWMTLGRQFTAEWSHRVWDLKVAGPKRKQPYFAIAVAADREQQRAIFLAATPRGSLTQENIRWNRDTLIRLGNAIRAGLETLELQRELIVREKSKAHVSLSRNLGHDLTNVIATSKLELDTVRRFLQLPGEQQLRMDPPMRHLFTESLEGLLHNTCFLQEIIDIYRSFSYVRHPQYERTDINALVREIAGLFGLSVSRRVHMHLSLDGDLRPCHVEPRLLKLAVFNLLTNATDSCKRRVTQEGDFAPTLWIETRCENSAESVTISVRDNGLGIRNQRGEPAEPEEIRAIFHGGFTTKREGLAEGLGLSWVRQIVYEFHRGRIEARNVPEGGAEVSLILPWSDSPPDRNGAATGGNGTSSSEPTSPAEGNRL